MFSVRLQGGLYLNKFFENIILCAEEKHGIFVKEAEINIKLKRRGHFGKNCLFIL
jgi:hypothetical protein